MDKKQAREYLAVILPFCDKIRIQNLLSSLGFNGTPNAALCLKAWETCGADFSRTFGNIALDALDSKEYRRFLQQMETKEKGTGDGSKQWWNEHGSEFMTTMATIISQGLKVADDYATKEQQIADSNYRAEAEKAKAGNTTYIALAIVAALVIIAVLVATIFRK